MGRATRPHESPPVLVLIRPNETPMSHFFSGRFWENLGGLDAPRPIPPKRTGSSSVSWKASLFQASRARTIELAVKYTPRVVGISVLLHGFAEGNRCRHRRLASGSDSMVNVVLVLGGHGASFVHQEILENNPFVDAVIRGEGERSLLALLTSTGLADWPGVPNLSYRAEGRIVENPIGPVERDLDNAPLPHRFVRDIVATDPVLAKSPLMIVSSRASTGALSARLRSSTLPPGGAARRATWWTNWRSSLRDTTDAACISGTTRSSDPDLAGADGPSRSRTRSGNAA